MTPEEEDIQWVTGLIRRTAIQDMTPEEREEFKRLCEAEIQKIAKEAITRRREARKRSVSQ